MGNKDKPDNVIQNVGKPEQIKPDPNIMPTIDTRSRMEELRQIEEHQCQMAMAEINAILDKYGVSLQATAVIPATQIIVVANKR